MKIIHHEKLLRLILSASHSSTFSDLINQLMASVAIMLRFKEKDRDKKKATFTVARMKFLLNFQAQKTTQERIIVERFSSLASSTSTFTPETVHTVISIVSFMKKFMTLFRLK